MDVTIRDVARAAGVSVTAASRALNGKGELREEKRALVLAAAERLQYVPNSVARALVLGRTKTIGVIITDNASSVYAEVLRGIEDVANTSDFGVLLCNSADSQEQALRAVRTLRAKQVDGVLLTPVQTDQRDVLELQRSRTPLVLLVRHFADLDTDYVVNDNERAGSMATGHLLELGHTRIGLVGGPAHISSTETRLAGYRKALWEAGIALDETLVVRSALTAADGYLAALQLMNRRNRPSAVYAVTFPQAMGVLKAARSLGVSVPGELALVAGDDAELADYLEVPLSATRQPAREIGARGAEILIAKLNGEHDEPRHVVVQPELIVRASSGAS